MNTKRNNTHKRNYTRKRNYTHKRNNTRKRNYTRKRQRGGLVCTPCLLPSFGSIVGLTAGGLGVGKLLKDSYSHKSSMTQINGDIKRSDTYELLKNKKKKQYKFQQIGKQVITNKRKKTYKTLKQATKAYNDKINKCIKNGFKKC